MAKKLRMTEEQVKTEVVGSIARAKGYTDDIEFSPEDGSRSDVDFLCEVLQLAVDNGATTLNIPDTVGFGVPDEYGKLIAHIIATVNGDYVVSTHCHNDLGMAVANSLAGVTNGARQIESAVNGLGERAGNAALEEVVMAIRARRLLLGCRRGRAHRGAGPHVEALPRLTGYAVQYNKAVVGRNAFAHEAGSTSTACSRTRRRTRSSTRLSVGQEAAQIVLGKHSGRHAFGDTLAKMGLHLQGDALQPGVRPLQGAGRPQGRAHRGRPRGDRRRGARDRCGAPLLDRVARLPRRHAATSRPPRVVLADGVGGTKVEATGSGNGMIDAAFDAIVAATGVTSTVVDFKVAAVTGGGDAVGDTVIQLEADDRRATGRGLSTDVVEASARAYLNAINKLVRLGDRGERRERTVGP